VDESKLQTTESYMRTMNLQARRRDVLHAKELIVALYKALADMKKLVYFVGTSQGAAMAFTSALHIMALPGVQSRPFRGGFFHHMAGVYPSAFPQPLPASVSDRVIVTRSVEDADGRRSKRMKKKDLHGEWLKEEEALLKAHAKAALKQPPVSPATLCVVLSLHDHVVPIQLQSLLSNTFAKHKKLLPGKASAGASAVASAAA
tara:strand:- start:7950 stop:8558 length:609 start_codon:yes stop_codon:yes gene_type:complete